ncbi:SCP2 sterol-binding domain-containing protein [Gilvimarinus agarilyticus]|uniref:ubiquinone biosynthesis accessory factor UbiJ n=1 Tax=Gilvimarinus sp. 2_MG-2023 TaxID=3062666 RepID=UPI001C08C316|nr:SCP2 sterol-binding domain-containing protein [Gilvimarinus sp. 2_MG-2023]MBU2885586.1 SCP2 sterol-binding domain-containing protein [Gilvimarinus agarilyticus]MDO6570453.1 SCP2 sterol-binding domain-containing protein [Gilvimarinus sp. 2_MG-2023]
MLDRTAIAALAVAFEAITHKALAYDPASRQRLAAMQGQCLAIHCTAPALTLFILPGETLKLAQFYDGPVSCALHGSANDLLKVAAASDAHSLYGTGVSLEGSPQLLADLQAIFQTLDVDWEMWLADTIGTLPAHFIAQRFRQAMQWSRDRAQSAAHLGAEYVREESGAGLSRTEFDLFADDVNQTRLALDRLQARVDQLSLAHPKEQP